MTDREWLDKFDADFTRLRQNREAIPLQELQTKYTKAYNTLVAEVEEDAHWWADTYIRLLSGSFPRHPEDKAGNEWLDKKIADILEEERQPGGRVERYRAALIDTMDRDRFEHLVWEIYDRLEWEAFDPYWQRHCRWTGQPGNRWIYNDITKKFWYAAGGFWIDRNYKSEDGRFPPNIGEDTQKGT